MEIKGEYRIARAREEVWRALNDPALLAKCIPGCESLELQDDGRMHAQINAAIGPVRARFDTRITLENLNPPASYTLAGESKSGAAGFGRGRADVRLSEEAGGTVLDYDAHFTVGGRLAQVGSRLVLGATRKMADDFFGRFSRELDPAAQRVEIDTGEPAARKLLNRTLTAAALAALLLLIWWFLLR
ncbi:MAG: SRPBCC family protein [Woeseiaceae bacterium]